MIYPNNIQIGQYITKKAIEQLYKLPVINAWDIEAFAKRWGVIITTKEDIRQLALSHGLRIRQE